ncbi:RNA-guided endonuclease InsQ/TnpB family protein [Desulfonema ishimotonii]|nr:RNA-guided endonuclease TnpB family protein [Desulfonema ishimotonii]
MNITPATCENQAVVGVDLGVRHLATLSDGEIIEGPKAYRKSEKKLRRFQQSFARKQKGSRNRERQKRKISRTHYRISCMRQDALHKLTTRLVRKFSVIVIEDLNVRGMLRNGGLAKAISDMGFYEFRRQLGYKARISGVRVIIADRWFPSSKRCSACGEKHPNLTLSDRTFVCPAYSLRIDRDLNAARNLEMYPGLMAA